MNRSIAIKKAAVAITTFTALGMSLLQCNQPATVGTGTGGASANNGGSSARDDASIGGQTGGSTAVVLVNLDVIPAWWGEADAPQAPDTPPPPSADANCGTITSNTTRKPADVMLLLDRSASMDYSIEQDCYCAASTTYRGNLCDDTTNCKTRWESIKPAVTTTLANSKYVNWGLKFFPTGTSGNCNVSKPSVEVKITENSAGDIQGQIETATLSLSTPTAAAITAAKEYLQSLDNTNDKFILLATDGEPNCGTGDGGPPSINIDDVEGASAAAAAAKDAGFPVYVVGIGPNLGNLTRIAESGGTTNYYQVTSPEQLVDALSKISKSIGSCEFKSDEEPPDPENVAVYVNKELIEKNADQGWKYGDTWRDIKLTGSYCEAINAGEDTNVQILFGCPGGLPFPPIIQ